MNTLSEDLLPSSIPAGSSQEAHCQRVAALAQEIGRLLPATGSLRQIEAAAWLHDYPNQIFPESVREVIRVANAVDEMIEWLPIEHRTMAQILEEVRGLNPAGMWRPEVEAALQQVVKDQWKAALAAGKNLPVSALSAIRKLALTPPDEVSVDLLYKTAGKDPVLTADVLRVVNSWEFPWLRTPLTSLKDAIVHLGTDRTRAVLLASAARGVFASKTTRGLWKHSVEAAASAREFASQCGCDPEEAFVAGLLHDIGRLAVEMLDSETAAKRKRLEEQGLTGVWIDLVTCRHDHGEIGGSLLSHWNFPQSLVNAVALHHSPERSEGKLASILYLAELRSGEPEDETFSIKLNHSLLKTGLTLEQVHMAAPRELYASILAA